MRVLILGAGGMLGSALCRAYRDRFETWATVRGDPASLEAYDLLPAGRLLGGVDARAPGSIVETLDRVRPDAVINAIGIVKQRPEANDPLASIAINALFPHQLAQLCRLSGARLVHISTDCVFSGRRGRYCEEDPSDAEDLYGRSKFLGEVSAPGCLTLRTSIIGYELGTRFGLLEWFLAQRQTVSGFARAIFSGFPAAELAQIIATVLDQFPELEGVWQVASDPISKYDLLCLFNSAFGKDIAVLRDESFVCDRSLDGSRFRERTGFVPQPWPVMVETMAQHRRSGVSAELRSRKQ